MHAKSYCSLFFLTCLLLSLIAFPGCIAIGQDFTSGVRVPVRLRIFEISADKLTTIIDDGEFRPSAGSSYRSAVLPADRMQSLVLAARPDTGMLTDRTDVECFWPRRSDAWSYGIANGKFLGSGGGAGWFGIRPTSNGCEVKIDFEVSHGINTRIVSTIVYDGIVSQNQSIVFVAPFTRTTGEHCIHVISFTLGLFLQPA
jgi:hypothetical protein